MHSVRVTYGHTYYFISPWLQSVLGSFLTKGSVFTFHPLPTASHPFSLPTAEWTFTPDLSLQSGTPSPARGHAFFRQTLKKANWEERGRGVNIVHSVLQQALITVFFTGVRSLGPQLSRHLPVQVQWKTSVCDALVPSHSPFSELLPRISLQLLLLQT